MARSEAWRLLTSGNADTNRDLLVWAIGYQAQGPHCLGILDLQAGRYRTELFGHSGDNIRVNGVRINGQHAVRLFRLSAQDLRYRLIAEVTWPEVAALVTPERVGADLMAEMRAAMSIRRERTHTSDPTRPTSWWTSAEAAEEARLWNEIEHRCDDIGHRAWMRCRPADEREPADLLELLATIGGDR